MRNHFTHKKQQKKRKTYKLHTISQFKLVFLPQI